TPLPVCSRLEMQPFCRQLFGLLLSYMSWTSGIVLAISRSWRVWEFDSKVVPVVFIGLWDVFYIQKVDISGVLVEMAQEHVMNESWAISDEISYAQDMILLANFIKLPVLIFGTLTLWVSWIKAPYPDFLRMYYKMCACLLLFSSVCTASAVIWNFYADFSGNTTFDFPPSFPVKKEALIGKRWSYVLPLGITTASMSVISALSFLFERYLLTPQSQM
ncbi:uncharacterized protein LOC111822153, partial [Trichechus manatus latirostris]|uniref:Uncharacterized protein LOC111822153 n=1 Tax=Trichechus manatus latirostris TaxID=127582 RepID=A0A2Y9RJ71_TRIMA